MLSWKSFFVQHPKFLSTRTAGTGQDHAKEELIKIQQREREHFDVERGGIYPDGNVSI